MRAVILHLAIALPLAWLSFGAAFAATSAEPMAAFRTIAALPTYLADERTRRYVLCLAIPLLALPIATALWLARAGDMGPFSAVARAFLCGLASTAAFWLAVEVALATATTKPSLINRFVLRHAWLVVLVWSFVHTLIASLAHAITMAFLRRARGR